MLELRICFVGVLIQIFGWAVCRMRFHLDIDMFRG